MNTTLSHRDNPLSHAPPETAGRARIMLLAFLVWAVVIVARLSHFMVFEREQYLPAPAATQPPASKPEQQHAATRPKPTPSLVATAGIVPGTEPGRAAKTNASVRTGTVDAHHTTRALAHDLLP